MDQQDRVEVSVTGPMAQRLGGYRLIFQLANLIAAIITSMAAYAMSIGAMVDWTGVCIYLSMSFLFVSNMLFSIFRKSTSDTYGAAITSTAGGTFLIFVSLVNELYGVNSGMLAKGAIPYASAWLVVGYIAIFVYLPSHLALRVTLTVNTLLAILTLYYAGQHSQSSDNPMGIAFFTVQVLLVNNLAIGLLMLHTLIERKASEIVTDSLKSMREVETHSKLMRHIDPQTGCYNASGIQESLQGCMDAAIQNHLQVNLLTLKLDHQSETHERLGEIVFQELIKNTSGILARYVENSQSIGRYSGALFMLWFAGNDAEALREIARKIQQDLDDLVSAQKLPSKVVWSFGGIITNGIRDVRYLIDQALYELHKARHQEDWNKISISNFSQPAE